MSWREEHERSGRYAATAEELCFNGRDTDAREYYLKAAEAEEKAAESIDPASKPKTLGIIAVSAVALWYRANEPARVRTLASKYLQSPALLPSAREELEELLSRVDESKQEPKSRGALVRYWAVAAALVLVFVLGSYFITLRFPPTESYATKTGERHEVEFRDGSVAYLNTRTTLAWARNASDRRVVLVEGEALFVSGKHDKANPFSVAVDNSEIVDFGTRFNVYRKPSGETTVTVLEGNVEVRGRSEADKWERQLAANEQIIYGRLGILRDKAEIPDADRVIDWRTGNLQFREEPLSNVVGELQRYTDKQLLLADADVGSVRITGSVPTGDLKSFTEMIRGLPIKSTDEGNVVTFASAPVTSGARE